jgi:hypothetical protein
MQLPMKHLTAAKQLHAAMQQQAQVCRRQAPVVYLSLVLLALGLVTAAGCSCSAALMR